MKEINPMKVVAIVILCVVFSGCDRKPSAPATVTNESVATNAAPVSSAVANPEYAKLKARWERPDGGYVLEIRDVAADGKADAGYFNPSPINVERAQIYSEGGITKVFVILRDANYPGCTYRLSYDAKADQLFGQYFQSAMQETFDVTFGRQR
jgi:hypothetical protein